jgi:hypothetical protein
LNRVFDVIGFVYPDYCFPARKKGMIRKIATMTSSIVLKPKKAKVLTYQLKSFYLERAAKLPTTETSKAEATEAVEETHSAPEVILLFLFNLNQGIFDIMLLLKFLGR